MSDRWVRVGPMRSLTIVLHEQALAHLESFRRVSAEIAELQPGSRELTDARLQQVYHAHRLAVAVDWAVKKEESRG